MPPTAAEGAAGRCVAPPAALAGPGGGALLPRDVGVAWAPDGAARVFESSYCRRNFTLPSLASVFAAHAVEWNVMGKERPWWSVMSSDQYRGETLALEISVNNKHPYRYKNAANNKKNNDKFAQINVKSDTCASFDFSFFTGPTHQSRTCLLYTSDAADE